MATYSLIWYCVGPRAGSPGSQLVGESADHLVLYIQLDVSEHPKLTSTCCSNDEASSCINAEFSASWSGSDRIRAPTTERSLSFPLYTACGVCVVCIVIWVMRSVTEADDSLRMDDVRHTDGLSEGLSDSYGESEI